MTYDQAWLDLLGHEGVYYDPKGWLVPKGCLILDKELVGNHLITRSIYVYQSFQNNHGCQIIDSF